MSRNKINIIILISIIFLGIILFILNLFIGSVTIPFSDLFNVFFSEESNPTVRTIVMDYRLPQAVTAMFAGAALSISGLLMQTLFRNPLADPSMLGISSGAGLGVAITILLTGILGGSALSTMGIWSNLGVSLAAFVGATFVLMLILGFSSRLRNMTTLIIIGLMISYLAGSLTDIMKFFSMKEDIHAFVIWGMGSFSAVGTSKLMFFSISVIIGLFASLFLSKNLNVILLGDLYAENLGINVKRNNLFIILISGYLTAIVTAYCGPIAFLGLAIPHLARFTFKTSDHRILTPAVMLIGMTVSLLCNLVARMPGFEGNLPINAVTAFIGAPVVIWVILRKR
ncbi:MAG: iron ABC transporter permease [Bacteroidales bacterium]|nr:iron ABC transporter permease [Bacteroidales bacterium]MBR5782289.1 iron ABC transporter permease [Bacteroidales bacterium]